MNRYLAGATAIGLALSLGGIGDADSRNGQRSDDERLDPSRNPSGDHHGEWFSDTWKLDFDPDELRHFDYWDAHDLVAVIRD
jgi:hypothetical protein